MAVLTNDDVRWYVGTRKDTGAHTVRNEIYMENYEREYERLREFDTVEEAIEACEIRQAADVKPDMVREKGKLRAGKLRGDVKEGSKEDEELRATIKAEVEAEIKASRPPSSRGAKMGAKTAAKTQAAKGSTSPGITKHTKAKLE